MPQKSLLTWAGYNFDVVVNEAANDQVQIAKHSLEDGTEATEHIIHISTPLSADVLLSDIPADGSEYRIGRSDDLYLSLLQDMSQGTVGDLITGVRVYPDMVLTGIQRVRSRPEFAAHLSLRWEPKKTVSGIEVAVPLPYTSTIAAASKNVGKKTPEQPADETVTKSKSILFSIFSGE